MSLSVVFGLDRQAPLQQDRRDDQQRHCAQSGVPAREHSRPRPAPAAVAWRTGSNRREPWQCRAAGLGGRSLQDVDRFQRQQPSPASCVFQPFRRRTAERRYRRFDSGAAPVPATQAAVRTGAHQSGPRIGRGRFGQRCRGAMAQLRGAEFGCHCGSDLSSLDQPPADRARPRRSGIARGGGSRVVAGDRTAAGQGGGSSALVVAAAAAMQMAGADGFDARHDAPTAGFDVVDGACCPRRRSLVSARARLSL